MQDVSTALSEVKDLYHKVVGRPAPRIEPQGYVPFPVGVDPVEFAVEEVRQMVRFASEMAAAPAPVAWIPRADAFVTKDGVLIQIEIPGVAREDVKVFSTGAEIVVRGERKPPAHASELKPLACERPWGPFERRFAVTPGTQLERISARCMNGVLEVNAIGSAIDTPGEKSVEIA
jgi:HSP20 family protein